MDLHLNRLHWEHRLPDWPAAAVAGLAAGAALMVAELIWAALVVGANPWVISHRVAAILLGHGALQSGEFDAGVVAAALVTHYALGVVFGLVLGWIIAGFHWERRLATTLLIGLVFGAALYLVDFHVMTSVFPWMAALRGWTTLLAHGLFGLVAALMYWKLNRQEVDR